jgi:hypothetical protein
MINRPRAVSFVAALALVSTCAVADARTGNFGGGGRGVSFHGGFHRVAPHGGFHRFAPRSAVRVAPIPRQGVTHRHVRRDGRDFRRHHRHKFHNRDIAAGVTFVYGSFDPNGMAEFAQPLPSRAINPAAATGNDDLAAAASGPICRSADQVVPRERGGQTIVTVTRCYPPNE